MLFASTALAARIEAAGSAAHRAGVRHAGLRERASDMVSAQGLSRFLARRDGVPAGGASLRLSQGVAHLCGAATLPAHRRRGVQSALLAARLEVATGDDGDVAILITQPASKSQENVQRQGFELLYSRAILVRDR